MSLRELAMLSMTLAACASCGERCAAVEPEAQNTITVVGIGETTATADVAEIVFRISSVGPSVAEAVRQNASKIDELKNRLSEIGLDESKIRTSGFAISLTEQAAATRPPFSTIAAYRTTQNVVVDVSSLAKLSELLDEIGRPGTFRIAEVRYLHSRRPQLLERSRRLAVGDARLKAVVLADAAAAELGSVIKIVELTTGDASDSESAGDSEIALRKTTSTHVDRPLRAVVRITYALRPKATR